MPILIPSKNIYDIDNPKIRDNSIDKVTVSIKEFSNDNKYNSSVFNTKYQNVKGYASQTQSGYDSDYKSSLLNGRDYVFAICHLTPYYYDADITIPRIMETSYIQKVLLGKNEKNEPNIKVSIIGKKVTESVTANYDTVNKTLSNIQATIISESEDEYIEIPKFVEASVEISEGLSTISAYKKLELNDISNITDENILNWIRNDKIMLPQLTILYGLTSYSLTAILENLTEEIPQIITASGTRETYTAAEIQVTIYGNTIGVKLSDATVLYGNGNKPFYLEGNELLQDSGKVGSNSISNHLSDNILVEYSNGKETATLLCDISDYYEYSPNLSDHKGEKVISIDSSRMLFKLHDKVIPMVYGADGKDYPMSLSHNGTPKVYDILGTNIIYDGAVWQELTLRETPIVVTTPQLPAPIISINGDILYIESSYATLFDILADGEVVYTKEFSSHSGGGNN